MGLRSLVSGVGAWGKMANQYDCHFGSSCFPLFETHPPNPGGQLLHEGPAHLHVIGGQCAGGAPSTRSGHWWALAEVAYHRPGLGLRRGQNHCRLVGAPPLPALILALGQCTLDTWSSKTGMGCGSSLVGSIPHSRRRRSSRSTPVYKVPSQGLVACSRQL